jgi:rSAM/selenodomain-associated transferase 1
MSNNCGGSVVLMAKAVVPGQVKTRLTRGPGAVSPEAAAAIYAALFETTARRLRQHVGLPEGRTRYVLALDDPTRVPPGAEGWDVWPQGGGDLGDRLDRVWRHCGGEREPDAAAVAFFGCDTPDVPIDALRQIGPQLTQHEAGLGPVTDGGYWTLACRRYRPQLLTKIDWGTPAVYDQTHAAAASTGLELVDLPRWHDVDTPPDLTALLERLHPAREPALRRLADRIRPLTPTTP